MREIVEIALFTDRVAEVRRFDQDVLGAAPQAEWAGGATFSSDRLTLLVHERASALPDGPANEDDIARLRPGR